MRPDLKERHARLLRHQHMVAGDRRDSEECDRIEALAAAEGIDLWPEARPRKRAASLTISPRSWADLPASERDGGIYDEAQAIVAGED